MQRLFIPIVASLALAAPAVAAPDRTVSIDHSRQYAACMKLAHSHPQDAIVSGNAWREKGGGVAAEHCIAIGLFNINRFAESGTLLEKLAEKAAPDRPGLRAELYAQAGQAWEAAGQPKKALAAQNAGIALAPNNIELLLDRAVLLAGEGNVSDAILDLNQVLKLDAKRHDALALRATAYRVTGKPALAKVDIDAAIKLKGDFPEALLERGIQREQAKDTQAARIDFARVVQLSGKNSELAKQAQAQLLKLDAAPAPAPAAAPAPASR